MSVQYSLPSGKKTTTHKEEKSLESDMPSLTDYTLIAEENLFHPERKIPTEAEEVPPAQKPEFVLYGVTITDDTRLAYLQDLKSPYSTPGRGARQVVLRIGNIMSGYTLSEVYQDRVIMVKGDEIIEVKITDSSRQRVQEKRVTKRGGMTSSRLLPQQQSIKQQSIKQQSIRQQSRRVSGEQDEESQEETLRKKMQDLRRKNRESRRTQKGMTTSESKSIAPPSPPPTAGDNLF